MLYTECRNILADRALSASGAEQPLPAIVVPVKVAIPSPMTNLVNVRTIDKYGLLDDSKCTYTIIV